MTRFTRLFSSFRSQLCRFQFFQLAELVRLPGLATLTLCVAFAPFQVVAQNMVPNTDSGVISYGARPISRCCTEHGD